MHRSGWKCRALIVMSACGLLLSSSGLGCGVWTEPADEPEREQVESCRAGVRNGEWSIDCTAACNHAMACKVSYGDSNLTSLTCNDCLGSCVAGVSLGGNDLVEGSDEDRRSWQCAELVEGCSSLDHNCDLF